MTIVTGLCAFEERYAGTDSERRAGNWLARLLRDEGRVARVEPTHVHPGWLGIHATLAAAGVAASLIGRSAPAAGFALALAAATFLHLDLGGRPLTPRRLLFQRSSQNVVSPSPNPDAALRVVLCANYDAPRAAGAAAPGFARLAPRLQAAIGVPVGPFRLIFLALVLLLPILGARMAGAEADWLSILQIPSTIVLVVAAFALTEAELSVVSPGANDNASGVAAALATAASLDKRPAPNTEIWVALIGGGSTQGEAVRALLRDNDWPRDSTVFVCFDACGRGELRYETSSGWTVSYEADLPAVAACEQIVESAGPDRGVIAEPMRNGNGGLAYAAAIRRRRAITLGCRDAEGFAPGRRRREDVPAEIQPAAITRVAAFAESMIRELDADAGPEDATDQALGTSVGAEQLAES